MFSLSFEIAREDRMWAPRDYEVFVEGFVSGGRPIRANYGGLPDPAEAPEIVLDSVKVLGQPVELFFPEAIADEIIEEAYDEAEDAMWNHELA